MRTSFLLLTLLLVFVAACSAQPPAPQSATAAVPTVLPSATAVSAAAALLPPSPTAITALATTNPPVPSPTPEMMKQGSITLESCTLQRRVKAFCGKLTVLENRADPGGRKIDLRIAILPAIETPAEPDPIFFLAGGPGNAATESWAFAKDTFPGINTHRDIVLVDLRGTGGSHPLEYPPFPILYDLTLAKMTEAMRAWAAKLPALDGNPAYYTTAIAIDDIDEVRAALGYDKINLYGGSYGATAAQVYLKRHEAHVRSVVLDGGSLLDKQMLEQFGANAQRSLDLLFARCEADPACGSAYPSVRQELAQLMSRLREKPIRMADPSGGEPFLLTPYLLGNTIQPVLQDANQAAALPKQIHGYFSLLSQPEPKDTGATPAPPANERELVMRWTIFCSESWARRDVTETARLSKGTLFEEWAMYGSNMQTAACSVLPHGIVELEDGKRVRSSVPVLIMNGEADPQDPPENVANATRELPNSLTLILPNAGHTVGHLGCLSFVVSDFFKRGTTEGLKTDCVKDYRPLPFELGN